jgi:hypothetical protein
MAKALKVAAIGLGAIALVATGVGAVALGGLAGTLTVAGVSTSTLLFTASGLSMAASLVQKGPKVPTAQTDRLTASIDPRAFRKTVLGQTAFPIDVRYEEWSGEDQEYCDWIVAHASHAIDGLEEIWFNTELAWSASSGVTAKFRNYFWLSNQVLEGSPANAFSFNKGKWNGSARLTGCAYSRFRFKVTGNSKKAESPFSGGIPSRITAIGRGAKLYDPRRDSTVPGGNGAMRADDQSTWRYRTDDGAVIGENLPLQILRLLLGWRIRNPVTGEMRLATGSGIPARRIDLQSFIVAANLADELVNRSAGGQEPRFHGAAVVSEGDDPKTALDMLCAACCGRFRDTGGKLALSIAHNDLADAAMDEGLNDDDVVGAFTWDPDPALDSTPNVVRGRYVDASTASLYQLIDYPEVRIASADGMDRVLTMDLGAVESASQAQRIAKQTLQRKQYQREFTAPFDIRAWRYPVGSVVPFTFAALGFKRALFRVAAQELGQGGTCVMTLVAEHGSIYSWDRDDAAPVQAAEAIVYDGTKNPLILAIDDAATTAIWESVADPNGTKPADNADVTGDNVSKDTSNVGGVPANEVAAGVGKIPNIELGVDQAKSDIGKLFATYGDTASAAASRSAAETAAGASQTAQRNAEAAQGAAQAARDAANGALDFAMGARTGAETARDLANAAKAAAEQAKGDAVTQAQAAGGAATTATQKAQSAADSASAASTSAIAASTSAGKASDHAAAASSSASTASTKATEAGQSANAASTAASTASTRAGEASTSASAAATSEANALGYRNAASTSQQVAANSATAAGLSAAATLPIDFADLRNWSVYLDGSPASRYARPWPYEWMADTKLVRFPKGAWTVAPVGVLPAVAGRKLRIEFEAEPVDGIGGTIYIGLAPMDGAYVGAPLSVIVALRGGVNQKNGRNKYTYDFTVPDGWAYLRPYLSADVYSPSRWDFMSLRVSDVTDRLAAEASASAAAGSASSASTSATNAGQSASAASTAKTAAETARGQAETYRNDASQSATNASGSATTATQQAGAAASARDAAAGSATGAAGSAQTASAKATEAGQKADAASASATSASTKAGEASTSASQAASSASDALGSKNSAATSATNAAGSATTAGERASAASGSASSAATSASGASTSAGAAESAKTAAETARGQAQTFRDQASTSANDAAGAASTATQQAGVAASSATAAAAALAQSFPSAFDPAGRQAYTLQTPGASSVVYNDGNDPNVGWMVAITGAQYVRIFPKGTIPKAVGRRYRATVRVFLDNVQATALIGWVDAAGNGDVALSNRYLGQGTATAGAVTQTTTNRAWVTISTEYTTTASNQGKMTPFLGADTTVSGQAIGRIYWTGITVEDVTSETAAGAYAAASATSASTASTKATEATQSASAASTARTAAETAKGQAESAQSSAASSASGAAGSASSAAQAASTAASYRDAAKGSADGAASSASSASSQASIASDRAAAAQASALLSASVGGASFNPNPNMVWKAGDALPTGWSWWQAVPIERVPTGSLGETVARLTVAAGQVGGPAQLGLPIAPGWWVMEVEAGLVSGDWRGSGVSIHGNYHIDFAAEKDSSDQVGATVAGRRSFSKLVRIDRAGMTNWHVMVGYATFGTIAAKTIDIYRAGIRRATRDEIDNRAAIPALQASVSQQAGALVDLQGRTRAFLQNTVQAGSKVARVSMYAESSPGVQASAIEFQADAVYLGNQRTLAVSDGKVGVDGDLYLRNGRLYLVGTTHMLVQGIGFGASGDLLEWYGPIMPVAQCSKSNGMEWRTVNGQRQISSFSVGRLISGNSNSSLASAVSVSTGAFGSNGGQIQASASWYWQLDERRTYAATSQGLADFRSSAQQLGAVGNGAGGWFYNGAADLGSDSTLVLKRSGAVVGQSTGRSGTRSVEGAEPVPVEGAPGYLQITTVMSLGITYTDPDRSTANREYTTQLTRGSLQAPTQQRVTVATVE